jgi:hypothetical protein
VPIGPGLNVTGTSIRNATTADCGVTIKVNGISPYQDVLPVGNAGPKDFSRWNYTLNPSYTSIQPGQNKITARLSCSNNPNIISHSSVNVTGITKIGLNATGSNYTTKPVSSNATTNSAATTTATTKPVSKLKASATKLVSSNPSAASVVDPPKVLSVSLHFTKSPLHPGDEQTITIKVSDKDSKTAVPGALISGKITDPTGPYKKVKGTTDDSGKASYSWIVGSSDQTGTYKFTTQVSAPRYEPYSTSKTFKVNPVELTGPATTSSIQDPSTTVTNTNINSANHHDHSVTSAEDNTYSYNNYPSPDTGPSLDSFNTNTNNGGHHNHHNHSTIVNPSTGNSNSNNNYLGPTIGPLYSYNRVVPAINPSYRYNNYPSSDTGPSLDSFNTNTNNGGHHNHHNHSTIVNPSTGNTLINNNVNNNVVNNNVVNNNINAVNTKSHHNHSTIVNPSTGNSGTEANSNNENLIPATNPSSPDNTVANSNTNTIPNGNHHNHHNHSTIINPSTDNSNIVNVNDSKSLPQSSNLPQINPTGSNSFVAIPSGGTLPSNTPIITSGPTNTSPTTTSDQSNASVAIPSGINSGSSMSGNSGATAPIITSGPTNTAPVTTSDQSKTKDNVPFLLPFH